MPGRGRPRVAVPVPDPLPISWQEVEIDEIEVVLEAEITGGQIDETEADEEVPEYVEEQNERMEEGEFLVQFEDAIYQHSPIVVFVYCDSEERRHRRAVAACDEFQDGIFGDYDVSVAIQDCVTLRLNGMDLSRDIRSKYRIARNSFPQVIVYDFEGRRLAAYGGNCSARALAETLGAAVTHCDEMAEELEVS